MKKIEGIHRPKLIGYLEPEEENLYAIWLKDQNNPSYRENEDEDKILPTADENEPNNERRRKKYNLINLDLKI